MLRSRTTCAARKNDGGETFLADQVIIHVGRDMRKKSCFKTHGEIAKTVVVLRNKVCVCSVRVEGCVDVGEEKNENKRKGASRQYEGRFSEGYAGSIAETSKAREQSKAGEIQGVVG